MLLEACLESTAKTPEFLKLTDKLLVNANNIDFVEIGTGLSEIETLSVRFTGGGIITKELASIDTESDDSLWKVCLSEKFKRNIKRARGRGPK